MFFLTLCLLFIKYNKFYPRKLNNLIKDELNGIQVTNYHNRST